VLKLSSSLYYYFNLKHGKEYTQSAASKLSQSFGLNTVAGRPITTKQVIDFN